MDKLLYLLYQNNPEDIKEFIKNSDVNKTVLGISPLMVASYFGNLEDVKMLVEGGSNLNLTDRNNLSALMYTCLEAPVFTLKRFHLLTSRLYPSEGLTSKNGELDRFKIAEYLLQMDSCTTFLSKEFKTLDLCDTLNKASALDIYMANSYIDNLDFIDLLLDYQIEPNYDPDYFYLSALDKTSLLEEVPLKRVLRKKAKYLEKKL